MDLQKMIAQAGGLDAIAHQMGVGTDQAANGLGALLPAVLGGFKKNAQGNEQGLGGLMGAIEGLGGGGLLDNVVGSQPTDINKGNDILGQVFGSKDVSRAVAAHASQTSGLDASILKKMLPIVAMLVAGQMARGASGQTGQSGQSAGSLGGLGGLLGGLLGGGQQAGSAGGLGGLAQMLDLNGGGNPLDDILGMAGKLTGR